MSKKNKKVAKASLFAMMTDMWADVRSGKVDAKSINLTKYAEKYHVGKFKRSMILPYIMQETCPTYEQACELRREVSKYINATLHIYPRYNDSNPGAKNKNGRYFFFKESLSMGMNYNF